MEFTKRGAADALEYEEAGLTWLTEAAADGGVPVVEIRGRRAGELRLERLVSGGASPAAAREFGRRLARTHAAGGRWWGAGPEGWERDYGYMGRLQVPLAREGEFGSWGEWYAEQRVLAPLRAAASAGFASKSLITCADSLISRLQKGLFDVPGPALLGSRPARLHGDLWSGNIIWEAERGGVLIDPAAQAGHAESDLAQLSVFGAPYVDQVYRGYEEVSPLTPGWRERIPLHQVHMLMVHVALFGPAYEGETLAAIRPYL